MRSHQPLADRLEGRDLLLGQVGEADRLARIDQGVLADEVLDLGLGARVDKWTSTLRPERVTMRVLHSARETTGDGDTHSLDLRRPGEHAV